MVFALRLLSLPSGGFSSEVGEEVGVEADMKHVCSAWGCDEARSSGQVRKKDPLGGSKNWGKKGVRQLHPSPGMVQGCRIGCLYAPTVLALKLGVLFRAW